MEVLPGLEGLVATANRERNTSSPDPAEFADMVTDQLMERIDVISRHYEEEARNVKELYRYILQGGVTHRHVCRQQEWHCLQG
jgi:hypothetical protein